MSSNFHYGAYNDQPRRYPRNNQERSQSPRNRPYRSPSPRQAPQKRSRSRDGEKHRLRTQDKPSNFTNRVSPSAEHRQRVSLDFKVFIKQKYLDQGICSFSSLDKIVRQCDIDDMLIDQSLEVPDAQGKILIIKGKSLDKKADAFTALMRTLADNEAIIYIPHTLVSIIIGSKGRTINQIKKDS